MTKVLKRSLLITILCILFPLNGMALGLNDELRVGKQFSLAVKELQALPKSSFLVIENEECMAGYQSASFQFFPKHIFVDGFEVENISVLSEKRSGVLVSIVYSVRYSEENLSSVSKYFTSRYIPLDKLNSPKKLWRDDKYVSTLHVAETQGGDGYLVVNQPVLLYPNTIQYINFEFYAKGSEWIATKNVGLNCVPNSEE